MPLMLYLFLTSHIVKAGDGVPRFVIPMSVSDIDCSCGTRPPRGRMMAQSFVRMIDAVLDEAHHQGQNSTGDAAGQPLQHGLLDSGRLGQSASPSDHCVDQGLQKEAAQTAAQSADYRVAEGTEGVFT
jgi:hypothetical protein